MPLDFTARLGPHARTAPSPPLQLNVRMPDGGWLSPPAEAGVRVMELIGRFGVALRDQCRGDPACTTCRARIGEAWLPRLRSTSTGLAAQTGGVSAVGAERLCICDLVMTADLDGLEIELTWDAIIPQTYWTAG
jgi:2Fe-2S ferredoxin